MNYKLIQIIKNMGIRYFAYRIFYELQRKTGILKWKFPTNPPQKKYLCLADWKTSAPLFFFQSRENLTFKKNQNFALKEDFNNVILGKIQFFNYKNIDLSTAYDWVTNPDSGFRYDIKKHWTEVADYSKKAGDIKYVWEKSRFSFLYTIIRYDYHFNEDHSQFVFQQILDWIEKNPINQGPNYKCSQEISLRIMNWTFALYFYKNATALTEDVFSKIIHSIFWQMRHVYCNINFSRITVRNNHAITETLMLYMGGVLFPFFPESKKWKKKGKRWFEKEIAYQIYEDGTYLQHSMNYHRVVLQLLTWAIRLSDIHEEKFNVTVYEKTYKSLNFLYQCQEETNGHLPNYGANDGALFYKLSNADYRDYRPQLDALHQVLCNQKLYENSYEDVFWYACEHSNNNRNRYPSIKKKFGIMNFPASGYYLIREPETFTFIRCRRREKRGRPGQADNLHIDIWYKGTNMCPDGGTFKYNTDEKLRRYFSGTESHNTVMINDYDQMFKGPRFIWYYWSQALEANLVEHSDYYEFSGEVSCFTYLNPKITHKRIIRKCKNRPEWTVIDKVKNKPNKAYMKQLWHCFDPAALKILTKNEDRIIIQNSDSWYSSYYGEKIKNHQITVSTIDDVIESKIAILDSKNVYEKLEKIASPQTK